MYYWSCKPSKFQIISLLPRVRPIQVDHLVIVISTSKIKCCVQNH